MKTPKKFRQNDIKELMELIRQYPLATLAVSSEQGIEAIHVPVLFKRIEAKCFLHGHIAKLNDVWKSVSDGSESLAIFNGPNSYISPNHYPTKAEHGKAVPTWNYAVVHARGSISFVHDRDWIYAHIDELTQEHESESENPWSIDDAPTEYIRKMLPAIVGIEIEINSIEGLWKLSQNQPEVNRKGVIQGLSGSKAPASRTIAAMVREAEENTN